MSKKRVKFSENLVSDVFEYEKNDSLLKISSKKTKINDVETEHYNDIEKDETHDREIEFIGCLLDSKDKNERLDINKISGQEDRTIEFDGDTKITPFNLKDELEDGYFDATGNFIFKQNKEEIKDNWLESVDWKNITDKIKSDDKIDEDEIFTINDKIESYKKLVELIKDNETIIGAIRRLGKDKGLKNDFELVTELADNLLQNGETNIYELTQKALQHKLSIIESQNKNLNSSDDELENAFKHIKTSVSNLSDLDNEINKLTEIVMWEYKWDNSKDAQIYGPFSTEQMHNWKCGGHFQTPIYCRKIQNQNSQQVDSYDSFYSSDRIDFELYL